jgi:hypothetical protein
MGQRREFVFEKRCCPVAKTKRILQERFGARQGCPPSIGASRP